jgi:hypothetical protein
MIADELHMGVSGIGKHFKIWGNRNYYEDGK